MYAPKSPLRKTSSYTGAPRPYQSQTRGNAGESSANPIPIMVGQIRTAADQHATSTTSAEDLSRYLAMLSVFYFTPKLPEADIASLVDLVGSLSSLQLTLVDIGNIARFVSRSCRTEQPNVAMFKTPGMQRVFGILLSDLCRTLQAEDLVEQSEHVCAVLLGLSCILQYSSTAGWLGQYRQYTMRALLLLHSLTLSLPPFREAGNHIAQLKLQAAIVEALGYAYAVPSDPKTTASDVDNGDKGVTKAALMSLLASVFPGVGGSESKLSAQVLELLVASVHTSHLYIKALPTTATPPSLLAETPPNATISSNNALPMVTYHTTTAQLTLLGASLKTAHLVFDSAHSVAKASAKKSGTKAVSALALRLNQRNSLLTSVESLLKDSVGSLGKRLALVAENYSQLSTCSNISKNINVSNVAGTTTPESTGSDTTTANTNITNNNTVKTSAFARAAYRPPSQRTNGTNTTTSTSNTTSMVSPKSLSFPPGFNNTNSTSTSTSSTSNSSSTNTNATTSTTVPTSAAAKALHVLRDLVTQTGLTFLGSLAAHDPVLFLLSWKNFLGESLAVEDALESKCHVITSAVSALISTSNGNSGSSDMIGATMGSASGGGLNAPIRPVTRILPTSRAVVQYSPILYHMLRNNNTAVRAAAVEAVVKALSGLQLSSFYTLKTPGTIGSVSAARSASTSRVPSFASHKSKSDDAGKYLHKITSALIVSLNAERQETVIDVLCKLGSLLLNQMPLSKVLTDRQVYLNTRSGYELQAVTMYHLLLKLSVHFEIPCVSIVNPVVPNIQSLTLNSATTNSTTTTTTSSTTISNYTSTTFAEGKPIFTSTIAMAWVTERCKGLDQSQAFAQALQLPYLSTPVITAERSSNLHSASLSSIGKYNNNSTRSSAESAQSQVSYIYAAVLCLLRAIPPGVMNNLYCITVRTLNTVLTQYHPALYVHDAHWLYNLLSLLETHAQPALRLQGSKMLFHLLEYDLRSIPTRYVPKSGHFGVENTSQSGTFVPESGTYVSDEYTTSGESFLNTYEQVKVVGRSVKENVVSLYRGCVDEAHIVRTQAMLTLGSLSPYVWRVLHGVHTAKLDINSSVCSVRSMTHSSGYSHSCVPSVRVLLLRCLLTGTTDTIGTVRAAAYKSLGDCVVHLCLLLSAQDDSQGYITNNITPTSTTSRPIHSLWSAVEDALMGDLMRALSAGLADTKLSVRIQAAWALGNVLINVLPYRVSYLQHQSLSMHAYKDTYTSLTWLQDESWIKMYYNLLPLLKDSEKMLATAVRCVGNTIAGMYAHSTSHHSNCIQSLHRELIQLYLVPEYEFIDLDHPFDFHLFANVKSAIGKHSQKLIFALSQTLGFVFHSSASNPDEQNDAEVARFAPSVHLSEIIELQLQFLRYGKLKIQLQAVQVLLYAVAKVQFELTKVVKQETAEGDNSHGLVDYLPQLVRLLECLFVLTRTTLSGGISTKQTSSFSTSSTSASGLIGSDYVANKIHSSSSGVASGTTTEPVHSVNSVIEKVLQNEQDAQETRIEVMQLFRSRATQLLHYFVLLLHTVVAQLWQVVSSGLGGAETTQAVLELLVFYGDDVTAWMSALQPHQNTPFFDPSYTNTSPFSLHSENKNISHSPATRAKVDPHFAHVVNAPVGFSYNHANTSVGLPHVHYDVSAQLNVQGKTPQILVAETCANLLRFTLSSVTSMSADPSSTITNTSESYRPERLPYALVARLEGLAQYAPFALQCLYLDAYSGTDGVRSALSGVGSGNISTYGVFDGLDYHNLFVPTSPPRKSPHKVPVDMHYSSDVYSSGGDKMGTVDNTDGAVLEEDEF